MNKKLVAVFLSVFICISSFFCVSSISLFAATSGTCGTAATYSYNESTNTLTISGTGAIKDYGTTVLNRVPWYDYRSTCTTLVINEGITEIGDRSFYQMTALKNVTLPQTLTAINSYAFSECSALSNIILPSKLETIKQYAFSACTSLESITFPDSLTTLGGNLLGGYCFSECPNLTKVTYGSGLTSTGKYAFYNSGVKTINWNDNITVVDNYSFFGCSLTKVEIPEQVTDINTRAFANNFSLSTVYVYNSECNFNGIVGDDPFNGSQQVLTFYGHSRSTTQTYAQEKGYNFISLDPCDHENLSENITVEAKCITDGEKQIVCDDCGSIVKIEAITALGHDFVTFETADMIDIDGHIYEYQSCSRCSEENCIYTHNTWVDGCFTTTTTATCTRGGIETLTCSICGETNRKIVSAAGHIIDDYITSIDPNCTQNGSKTGVCTICKETVTVTVPALGHAEDLKETYNTDDGHTYNTYTCSVCLNERLECVHNEWLEGYYTSDVVSQVTCTSNGSIEHKCKVCGLMETETIYMTGHRYDDGEVTTEPNCTNRGEKTYTCLNCNQKITTPVASLGHDYSINAVLKEPTCTDIGTGSRTCSRCSAVTTYTIAALGHNIENAEDYFVLTHPDCTEKGLARGTCVNCNTVIEMELDELGHDYDIENATVNTSPSCTETGTAIASCIRCFDETEITLAATGHNYKYIGMETGNYSTMFRYACKNCRAETTYSQAVLIPLFILNVNKNTSDINNGYRFDLNNDGIISARDYAMLKEYKK